MRSIMQNNVLFLTSQGHASQVLFDYGNKRLFECDFEPKTTGMRFPVLFFRFAQKQKPTASRIAVCGTNGLLCS